MVKTAVLSFRINDDTKDGITRAADAQGRSVSNLVERVLREWLVANGYLAKAEPGGN